MPHRLTSISASVLCMVVLVAMSGCGNEHEDVSAVPGENGAEKVITVFARALADGDGARACSLLSEQAQLELQARVGGGDCLAAVRAASEGMSPEAAETLRDVDLSDTRADGDVATTKVTLSGRGAAEAAEALGGTTARLVRVEAHWEIQPTSRASADASS